jgi:hypothetical protein
MYKLFILINNLDLPIYYLNSNYENMRNKNLLDKNCKTPQFSCRYYFFPAFVSIIFLSGCYQYQYVTIKSDMYQNEKKEYVNENDTLSIKYTFTGENCPITIGIYNKLQDSVYINWGKSSVIIDGRKLSYQTENLTDGKIGAIPPQTYVEKTPFTLTGNFFKLDSRDSIIKVTFPTEEGNNEFIMHSFNEKTSPLYFRSFLTLSLYKDFSSSSFSDNSFWVSGITQTTAAPTSFTYKPSNQFYIQKISGFGKAVGYTTGITLLVLFGYFDPDFLNY